MKIIEESNLFTRMRVGLSHLREHKFKHSFQDTLNPICSCGFDVKSTCHYIIHCPMYKDERYNLLGTIKNIDCRLLDVTETILIKTLLFGNCSVDAQTNILILNATTEYILTTKRFDESVLFLMIKSFWLYFPLYNDKNIRIQYANVTRR